MFSKSLCRGECVMSFIFPQKVRYDYFLKENNSVQFLFPITGLSIDNELTIGYVTFYNLKNINYEKAEHLKIFIKNISALSTVNTVAYVDVSQIPASWKEKCNNNLSIALMLIKQVIGLLYLTYYEYEGFKDQKRIIISENNKHECEEGMGIYLSSDGYVRKSKVSGNLWLHPSSSFLRLLYVKVPSFIALYAMDSEMKLKILKLFESLYHLLNEIHSVERILKMSAFLQFILLENVKEDFPPVSKRIRYFLDQNNIRIDAFGNTGKLNSMLDKIYRNIRNKYSHGEISLYEEYNVINASDYFMFFQVYMSVILLLVYNTDLKKIKSTQDLLKQIANYRP